MQKEDAKYTHKVRYRRSYNRAVAVTNEVYMIERFTWYMTSYRKNKRFPGLKHNVVSIKISTNLWYEKYFPSSIASVKK